MLVVGIVVGALVAVAMCGWAFLLFAQPPAPTQRTPSEERPAPEGFLRVRGVKRTALSEREMQPLIASLPEARVLDILDGDTVIVGRPSGEERIRLDSIDCPEGDQEWGDTAKYGLIKLIGGKTVQLEVHGLDAYGRTLATLYVRHADGEQWTNVNERMIALGHAWVMRKFYDHLPIDRRRKLNHREAWAKSKKVGLWKTKNPVPPWLWRNPHVGPPEQRV